VTVPTRAGDRLGDLGKAAKGAAVPGEARVEHHHPFQLALPLADEQRSGVETNPVLSSRLALLERTAGKIDLVPLRSANRTHSRLVEIAERDGLKPIGQNLQEQPSWQMSRNRSAQMIAPLKTKLVGGESGEIQDSRVELFSFALRRRSENDTFSGAVMMPSRRHHAFWCSCGLPARRELFDPGVAEILAEPSLWNAACSTMVSSRRARYVDPRSSSERSRVTAQPRLRNPVIAARVVCGSQSVAAISSSSVAPQSR
jgi:hypothetical protein